MGNEDLVSNADRILMELLAGGGQEALKERGRLVHTENKTCGCSLRIDWEGIRKVCRERRWWEPVAVV